jgi:NADPH:quinone reductase-like Zn-dependent oxidoreductase
MPSTFPSRQTGRSPAVPPDLSFDQVAPSTEGSHYALSAITKVGIGSGQDVLLNGGTGAIGSAAIQLLKDLGAHITAVADTWSSSAAWGPGRVIDRSVQDFTQDDHAYDVVFDAVGKRLVRTLQAPTQAERHLPLQRPGAAEHESRPRAYHPVVRWQKGPVPDPSEAHEAGGRAYPVDDRGEHVPTVVDRRYPLQEIVEAYRYVETRQKIGNVVIDIGG